MAVQIRPPCRFEELDVPVTIADVALTATFVWWWADPVAALGIVWFLVREGREPWRVEDRGCASGARAQSFPTASAATSAATPPRRSRRR